VIKKVNGWSNREGANYWGTDRLNRMIETRNLERERGTLVLLKKLPVSANFKVCDLGCGIGRRHINIQEMMGDKFEYIGIEREEELLKAGRKYFPDLEFVKADLQELADKHPEFVEYFDLVLTFHVLQYNHIEQQDEILKNIYRILKENGYFYMKENTIYEHNNIGYKSMAETHSINGHSYTEAGWIKKLKGQGFELVAKTGKDGHFIFRKKNKNISVLTGGKK